MGLGARLPDNCSCVEVVGRIEWLMLVVECDLWREEAARREDAGRLSRLRQARDLRAEKKKSLTSSATGKRRANDFVFLAATRVAFAAAAFFPEKVEDRK